MIEIWNAIVSSNTFNFIVMLTLLAWLVKKVDLKNLLNNSVNNISKKITSSKEEKEKCEKLLLDTKKSVENLSQELEEHINAANIKAESLKNAIISDANSTAEKYIENIPKFVESEEKKISSQMIAETVNLSKNLTINKIKNLLDKNPNLHEKLINESIEELNRIIL